MNLWFIFYDSEVTFYLKRRFFWKQFEYNWKTILKTIGIYHDLLKLSNIISSGQNPIILKKTITPGQESSSFLVSLG